uniref:BTB/POZ domain-containing protein 6-like n=1 Tax=Crassostrea virginica TaxID=6565 RepID=A0A8B8C705_CRAVI|nr:BTB/POZ domain-containing protein 6-like [Crassostrea virginica]
MAVSCNRNWQAGRNVLECNKFMLDNHLYCDVKFKVGKAGNLMSAHKYVLASRSSVFAVMFYGCFQETSDVIIVSYMEPDVFDILLRFIYYENGEVSTTTVTGTLYAAEKYAVTDLVDLCRAFLESNMCERTVCDIMENARFFSMTDLHAKCLTFIFQSPCYARIVFKSSGFLRCSRDGIESLIKDDELPLEEEIIYQSLIRWAEHRCKKEKPHTPNPVQIRKTLGNLIFHVRFPLMSLESFLKDAGESEILSAEEKSQISRMIAVIAVTDPVFVTTPRLGKGSVISIRTAENDKILYYSFPSSTSTNGDITYNDTIDFNVNIPTFLHGLELYGSDRVPYAYIIEVDILYKTKTVLSHLLMKTITESTKIFQINLDHPCKISPNKKFTVRVEMTGPTRYMGRNHDLVTHGDYTFKFYASDKSLSGTNVSSMGEIAGLLCYLSDHI